MQGSLELVGFRLKILQAVLAISVYILVVGTRLLRQHSVGRAWDLGDTPLFLAHYPLLLRPVPLSKWRKIRALALWSDKDSFACVILLRGHRRR